MKIKKYIAPTMPDAMKRIRQDFGKDGVILNSKEVRTGGFLGFFTKPALEVIAAYDPDPLSTGNVMEQSEKPLPTIKNPAKQSSIEQEPVDEINEKNLFRIQDKAKDKPIPFVGPHLPQSIEKLTHSLTAQGIQPELRTAVVDHLLRSWYREDSESVAEQLIEKWLEESLLKLISDRPFGEFDYTKKFLNLIGPTGVGKTTTIAKIAADAVLNKKKKAALITTDTYRIAAIDQLKTYAEILNIPLEIAYNNEDFKQAKERFKDYDVIFVDSAGRNFKNKQYVQDLKQIIQFDSEMENYLVLSMTSKYSDMIKIANQFTSVPIKKLIFTKKDETDTYGDLLNILHETGLGIAYVTTGQNVPDDITEATPQQIVSLLIGDRHHA
ncbi:flagellar biosynthesis protein FlhF [Alkalihalobacillus sp. AL-G]|uniref:flagellar biosynthesis protein FlhF n=1 Tax=Alkalihalobacillus sp. AL-G TaxID=2926399 RepID=UPI0027299B0A|nr:flagellar biosynthesis protein FlhF [Alkalihalobacillus sp. AL-G]WLD95171.1 flagellar biosynthesis protein FlhF [Alkalihalobacillus sp. AL-G]